MIRVAKLDDAAVLADIYAPSVRDAAVSFEKDPPTAEEFRQRMAKILPQYPWLVMEKGGEIAGYAYASEYRSRHAYRWSVATSVYIHPRYQRQGVGLALYHCLFAILRRQGYYNAFAAATVPNAGSEALHKKAGFVSVGYDKSSGFKLGKWHDVMRWQLVLQPHAASPVEPVPFSALPAAEVDRLLHQSHGIAA